MVEGLVLSDTENYCEIFIIDGTKVGVGVSDDERGDWDVDEDFDDKWLGFVFVLGYERFQLVVHLGFWLLDKGFDIVQLNKFRLNTNWPEYTI